MLTIRMLRVPSACSALRAIFFGTIALAASVASWAAVQFQYTVIDSHQIPNGHKPKVIGDFANTGYSSVGAAAAYQGFKLYKYPDWTPHLITTYGNGPEDEDAQVADVNGDGALDIIVGSQSGNTYWLENPLMQGRDPYNSTWSVHQIGFGRPSHDVVVGDINRDGKVDIATETGIYLQGATPDSWVFVGAPNINRSFQGTQLANLLGDGYLDLIAPDQSGTRLVWFENPLHRGGDPVRDIWTTHIIDASPGFSGYMTIAAADINQDGHIDVVLCPMYNDGSLVWYGAPADPRGATSTWVKHGIGPASYVHQGSLQILDFDGDGHPDIAFAEQEQSVAKRVGIYFSGGAGSTWTLQLLATSGGHNPKAGVIGNDLYPSIFSANHGYFGAPNPLELWRNTATLSLPPQIPLSDNFNASTLNTNLWRFVNPVGNGSYSLNGSELLLTVPAGSNHDPAFGGANNSVRVVQPVGNSDFTIEVKFDSIPTLQYQFQGLLIEQDSANYLRFQIGSTGGSLIVNASKILSHNETMGVLGSTISLPAGTTSLWLRVQKSGSIWTQFWSTNGSTFNNAGSFTQALMVADIGPFVGNYNATSAPATTAYIDYFFNTASPLVP